MKFNERYHYDDDGAQNLTIDEVIGRVIEKATWDTSGRLEEMRAVQAELIRIVARMAQELSPESQKRLTDYFGFDVAEEKT
jgi:hypothetical protein